MTEYSEGVDHGEQLEDVSWICLLGRRELAALVSNRMVNAVIVGLSEHGRDSHLTGIRRKDRAPARIECA